VSILINAGQMTSATYTQGVYVINMGSEWTYDLGKLL